MVVRVKKLIVDPALGVTESIAQHPALLTADDLADALCMSPKTIYAMAKTGKLPAVRIGQSIRFEPKSVAQWLRDRTF